MRIEPCKEDIKVIFGFIFPAVLLGAMIFGYLNGWNSFAMLVYSLIFFFVSLMEIPAIIYVGRSFILDAEGWTISIGKYKKTYAWDEIAVSYYKNDHGISVDDWPRPGILLTASPLKRPSRLTAMPACIYHHPLVSVFLRFKTDDTNYIAAKVTYEGYVVEKEELLAFFEENHIEIRDSHLIK